MRYSPALFAFTLVCLTGVDAGAEEKQDQWEKAKAILAKPDQIELYSLYPELPPAEEKPKETFHGWKVLGKTVVKDAESQKKILAVAETITAGTGAKCFDPRHGIRVTSGGKSVDLIICFECSWVYVHLDKDDQAACLTIKRDQQPALNKILTDAKVPLPAQAKE